MESKNENTPKNRPPSEPFFRILSKSQAPSAFSFGGHCGLNTKNVTIWARGIKRLILSLNKCCQEPRSDKVPDFGETWTVALEHGESWETLRFSGRTIYLGIDLSGTKGKDLPLKIELIHASSTEHPKLEYNWTPIALKE
jgi:hypothetical protein